jgi:hypothetical protein
LVESRCVAQSKGIAVSNDDFQERLRRISAKAPSGGAVIADPAPPQKPPLRRLITGVILVNLGGFLIGAANLSYEDLRDSSGPAAAIGFGLFAFATVILGLVLTVSGLKQVKAHARSSPPSYSGSATAPAPLVASATGRGPNIVLMIFAVFAILLGGGLIRFTNENYERLRADGGTQLTLAFGIAAVATILLGIVWFWRSLQNRPAPMPRLSEPAPVSRAAGRGPLLFGLALGVIACFSIFMTSAARLLNPATDNIVSAFAFLAAVSLTLLAFLIGIIGLFRRGSTLRRVPLYYLAGAILTYAAFRLFYIDLRTWPWFVSLVQ